MSFWTAIVVIVAICGFVVLKRSHLQTRFPQGGDDSLREAELQRELEELRERVKVLERIATDDGEAKRLSAEIDQLRDG